jgi:hypothetical protein
MPFLAGFGAEGRPQFWIDSGKPIKGAFCICSQKPSAVHAFYAAALQASGKVNGPPGLRPHYHENDYGAFVLDPDGHTIAAVCHLAD